MGNLAVLVSRAVMGSLLAGHGAQKLFGSFNGPGLEGTSGWMESHGLRTGRPWAVAAGLSEFGGGVLMILGFTQPDRPSRSHRIHGYGHGESSNWELPIWVTERGAELPVTNTAIATALMLNGPGKYSLDRALGIRWLRWLVAILGLMIIALTVAIATRSAPPPQEAEDEAREELAGEEEA